MKYFLFVISFASLATADQTIAELTEKITDNDEIVAEMLQISEDNTISVSKCFRKAMKQGKFGLARFLLTDPRVGKIKDYSILRAMRTATENDRRAGLDLLLETGHISLEKCFRECAFQRRTHLARAYLCQDKDGHISDETIGEILAFATAQTDLGLIDVILGSCRAQPVDLADCCAIADEEDNDDLVATFDEGFATWLYYQQLPPLIAVVTLTMYLQRSRGL